MPDHNSNDKQNTLSAQDFFSFSSSHCISHHHRSLIDSTFLIVSGSSCILPLPSPFFYQMDCGDSQCSQLTIRLIASGIFQWIRPTNGCEGDFSVIFLSGRFNSTQRTIGFENLALYLPACSSSLRVHWQTGDAETTCDWVILKLWGRKYNWKPHLCTVSEVPRVVTVSALAPPRNPLSHTQSRGWYFSKTCVVTHNT